MSQTTECDLLIIGAGPAGLFAAYYAGFRDLSTVVVDSLPEPGGQVTAMYPEKLIYDVAGFPAIKGQDLVDQLVEQAAQYSPAYLLGHSAEQLHNRGEHVEVVTSEGATIHAKAVIITGGIGTFSPRPLPGAEQYEGRGLRYFVPRLDELRDQDVLIVGGGDSAFDWAQSLTGIARSLTLIHRRDKFRAHEGTVRKVLDSPTEVLTPYELVKVEGDDGVRGAQIRNSATDELRELPVQGIVAALGFIADMSVFASWGLEQRKRHLVVDAAMRTNVPRVFAAGDIVDYASDAEAKVRLIAVGFGEAATAVNNAVPVIRPGAKVFPGHSSDPL